MGFATSTNGLVDFPSSGVIALSENLNSGTPFTVYTECRAIQFE